jgi:hypothetical protein
MQKDARINETVDNVYRDFQVAYSLRFGGRYCNFSRSLGQSSSSDRSEEMLAELDRAGGETACSYYVVPASAGSPFGSYFF